MFITAFQNILNEIEELFEHEANNFASEALFQLDKYEKMAADYTISIKTPIDLSKKFGSSVYASTRRYVQTHFSPLALGIYNKIEDVSLAPWFCFTTSSYAFSDFS